MSTFDVDEEKINVFKISDTYIFTHYFKGNDVFTELKDYYNQDKYRFEVNEDDLKSVEEILEDNFFETNIIEDLEPFFVVKEKYTEHADILKNSVLVREVGDYNVFLMKNEISVEQAIENKAEKLKESDIEFNPPEI